MTLKNQFSKLASIVLFTALALTINPATLPVNAIEDYKIPKSEMEKINSLVKNTKITRLVALYQEEYTDNIAENLRKDSIIKTQLESLSTDDLIAFKRLTRKGIHIKSDSDRKNYKRSVLADKFEYELVKKLESKLGKNKTIYNSIENINKNDVEKFIYQDSKLLDLLSKIQNPDQIPDYLFEMKTNAYTALCGWDSNWPSSLAVGSHTWQGPTYWYNPTSWGDARNGYTDVICDFKVGGVPTNMKAIHGRNYQGTDAIDCWQSLISKSTKNETLSGFNCASQASIYSAEALKNNVKFRKY